MNDFYNFVTNDYYAIQEAAMWATFICALIAVVGAILVYVFFLTPQNRGRFTGFLGWLYDFLNFRKMFGDILIRILYVCTAIYLTISGVCSSIIAGNLIYVVQYTIIGNVIARLVYELLMVLISLCRNVADINRKMGGTPVSPSAPVSPVPQDPAAAQPAAPEQPFRRPEPVKPAEPKPAAPEQPFQRPEPVKPVEPQPAAPAQPFQRPEPVKPAEPQPAAPAQPFQRPEPVKPAEPQPAAPAQPFQRPEPPKMQTVKPDIPVESPFQRPAANNAPEAAQQADTKFCRNCGKRIAADAADCPFCGFHLMP